MNNNLLFLLPLLMNGNNNGEMMKLLSESLLSGNTGNINPMALLLLSMMGQKNVGKNKEQEGTETVKEFGGNDVFKMLQMILQNKNQSEKKEGT